MAQIEIEGQKIEVEDCYVKSDKQLQEILSPFYPGVANARFERIQKKGEPTVIKVIKRAGSNGNPVPHLIQAAPAVNPAISLSWHLKRQAFHSDFTHYCIRHCRAIQQAVEDGRTWNHQTHTTLEFLKAAEATPSKTPIPGV
ncbi:hypothetical protein ACQ4M3_24320 [Leptolyngbya sp. AN03gr2]|uniref:hypothetical protein n=1 Tax=unclassified Leptolyngbya TaxID=2650499 RepID=UPI003D319AD6